MVSGVSSSETGGIALAAIFSLRGEVLSSRSNVMYGFRLPGSISLYGYRFTISDFHLSGSLHDDVFRGRNARRMPCSRSTSLKGLIR